MSKSIRLLMLVSALLMAGIAWGAPAPRLRVDATRLVKIEGAISGDTIGPALTLLDELVAASTKPVFISINSTGGDVIAGAVFINSIHSAQARGVIVHCFVPNVAMSMAFTIYAECSRRYAQPFTLLLFHPMRATLRGSYKVTDLDDAAKSLALFEAPFIDALVVKLGIPRDLFLEHYAREDIFTATKLNESSPGFTTIISGVIP